MIHGSEKWASFTLAVAAHATAIVGGSHLFLNPAEFGVDQELGGTEVSLVAAPVSADSSPTKPAENEVLTQAGESAEVFQAVTENQAKKEDLQGDGSSSETGRDETTMTAAAGVQSARLLPGHLKNKAPRYPEEARKLGQEGVVQLLVLVGKDGLVRQLSILTGSGYSLLDQAARTAVRRWQFEPARLGGLPLESEVQVPVRFRLDKEERAL